MTGAVGGAIHACGGTSSSPGSSGGAGEGGLSSSCPGAAPKDGDTCPGTELECEYGNDPSTSCNVVATCAPNSAMWRISAPTGTPGGSCPTKSDAACPATREALVTGSVCPTAGAHCAYPAGECVCRMDCGPRYPVAMTCEAGTPLTWTCAKVAAGCPTPRPKLGSACTTPNMKCNYGEDDCRSTTFACKDGTWHTEQTQCAISTGTRKTDIHYVDDDELRRIADETNALRLTTYRYKDGDPAQHLGIIIEDAPDAPAVSKGRDRVDLYAYASMAIAAVQVQQRELVQLRGEVQALRAEMSERQSCRKQPGDNP